MNIINKINRRAMLRASLGATAGTLAASISIGKEDTSNCGPSPEQAEDPFCPTHEQDDKDVDLTRVKGSKGRAKGELTLLPQKSMNGEFQLDLHIRSAQATSRYIQTLNTFVGRYAFMEKGTEKTFTITREDSHLFVEIDDFFPKVEIKPTESGRFSLNSRTSGYEIAFDPHNQSLTPTARTHQILSAIVSPESQVNASPLL